MPVIVVALSLPGGAGRRLDGTTAKGIHRIALLGPSGPETYTFRAQVPALAGTCFGLVGFAAAYAVAQAGIGDTPARFTELVEQRKLHIMQDVADSAEAALREKGYDAVRVPVPRPDASASLAIDSDPAPGNGCDARSDLLAPGLPSAASSVGFRSALRYLVVAHG